MTPNHTKQYSRIPSALIWAQCITFALLYAVWMIYELLYFRRVLLISGALLSVFSIYQYRTYLFQKKALALWLMVGLFFWAIFHLIFLAQDYPAQFLELRRIWKYAGLGGIFALGLGISLASLDSEKIKPYWAIIYFGLCLPVLIYLLRYFLTIYGAPLGITSPAILKINFSTTAYYIPKTDYIAFCLPLLGLSLGQILRILTLGVRLKLRQYLPACIYFITITAILFLFSTQNTKNGIAYAAILIGLFLVSALKKTSSVKFWHKALILITVGVLAITTLYSNLQKNDAWRTLITDTKIGLQLEKYPHWKDASGISLPNNEFGEVVSGSTYVRAAWFKAGLLLSAHTPLGYGLIEDSFGRLAKARWPDSQNLSHSHSGWLDLILGIGFPGFCCIFSALILNIWQSRALNEPWKSLVFWALIANLVLWVTTEVAATTSFSVLIFWISLASGLTLMDKARENGLIKGPPKRI